MVRIGLFVVDFTSVRLDAFQFFDFVDFDLLKAFSPFLCGFRDKVLYIVEFIRVCVFC